MDVSGPWARAGRDAVSEQPARPRQRGAPWRLYVERRRQRRSRVRGGSGLYYSIPDSNTTFSIQSFNGERILVNSFPNDGQPGFIQDPTRGRTPEDSLSAATRCGAGPARDRARLPMPSTWQSIVGMQKQIGSQLGFEADFTHGRGITSPASATRTCSSTPRPATTATRRRDAPIRRYGQIQWLESNGAADYAAISTALNRRYANDWQSCCRTLHVGHRTTTPTASSPGQQPVRS